MEYYRALWYKSSMVQHVEKKRTVHRNHLPLAISSASLNRTKGVTRATSQALGSYNSTHKCLEVWLKDH